MRTSAMKPKQAINVEELKAVGRYQAAIADKVCY
jgi:hypothetical protein